MTSLFRPLAIGSLAVLSASFLVRAETPASQAAPALQQAIDFGRDIQPIFEKYCAECHGRGKARAQLRLHSPEWIRKGGQSGPAVVPGDSHSSELMRRVLDPNDDDRMPLDADPLPAETIARLRAWIDQGAEMPAGNAAAAAIDEHWAYKKPVRPEPPSVSQTGWPRTPIDRFVLARLEREQLAPSPEAARATLLRRLSLDLIGLPPTPAELDAFVADTAPDAYERVVDRLLASPHYGERWARPWLDLARYADTNGYEKDNRRDIWKYRDWVIDAFNRDLPFDQFTVEQIAGDMLPNATVEQKTATGFHRNAMTNEEGGVDPEESRYEVLVDRTNTTATVWLGTTLACAQCHNHKYDPFTQKDYFRLLSFFANGDFDGKSFGDGTRYFEPTLDLATPEQEAARKELQAEIDKLDQQLKTSTPELREAQARWEESLRAAQTTWTALTPREANATNGAVLRIQTDGSVLASGANPPLTSYTVTATAKIAQITGIRIETLPDPSLPRGGPGRDGYGHFRVTGLRISAAPAEAGSKVESVAFKTVKVDDSAAAFDAAELLGDKPSAYARKSGSWAINAMRDTDRLPRNAVLAAATPFGFPSGTRLQIRIDHLDGTIGQGIGRFRIWVTDATNPLEGADLAPRLRKVLAVPASERSAAQADDLAAAFRTTTPLLKETRDALAAKRKALADLKIPSTLVMREHVSFERPSFELRVRGSFSAKGERVYAGTPRALPPMRDDLAINRLGLARWLVDPTNPLVARVAVNRLWEQIFGRGLVETSEDFGSQGSPPTHPELLDWLATELVAKKWSQKALLRTIVLSATYRQSSAVPTALAERDPDNRLFARGARVRLEAEMIRDVTLAVSGLLSEKMLGPRVFPLQPDGIWNMPYNSDKWTVSQGDDRFRRSLYTFWRRTSPYPSFMTFDATSREFCTVRRVRTNTPLQALTLLNDPASFEAARALAGRLVAGGTTPAARASTGVKLVLTRPAEPQEVERLVALYEQELAHYRKRGASDPELAAWTMVANVLLNLDEAITKE
jgi:Protein of unknown function (DUF1553)/Protein of unknown function (DUF1549)/Planctomycete cytochrome C